MTQEIEALKIRIDALERREHKRRAADSRANAAYLREEALAEGKPVPHCCGESGFGQADTDICPACEDQATEASGR